MKTILLLSWLVVACALPRMASSFAYTYRYVAPHQSRHEQRDVLGNVRGSYSVRYLGGGLLTQTYYVPSRQPVLRSITAAPPVSVRNSKAAAFLVEMLKQRLDERAPVIVTRTGAVVVEALPVFVNSKISPVLTELRLEREFAGGLTELQLRNPGDAVVVEAADKADAAAFINSKQSPVLIALRQQSLRQGLAGRAPPLFGHNSIIVEAAA